MQSWLKKVLAQASAAVASRLRKVDAAAYEAWSSGNLTEAEAGFTALAASHPDRSDYAYMLALACKYQRKWGPSLEHNVRAVRLSKEPEQGASWNAAIAATALGRWSEARSHWAACGLEVEASDEPIDDNYGTVSLRINPWGTAETLFAKRIDPARAYLMNVPLPESGYRYRDLVLHDGAKTGERQFGDQPVPVFNALQRLQQSEFITFAAFVIAPTEADRNALLELTGPGIGLVEDWSGMSVYCLRCSYGTPHADRESSAVDWDPERSIGIAAQSRVAVERLLEKWAAGGDGRLVDSVEQKEHALSQPEDGSVWWRGPDDEE